MKIIMMILFLWIIYLVGTKKYFDAANQVMYAPTYLQDASLAAGDYDMDGLQDIACGGISASELGGVVIFVLYHQNASLQFYDVTNIVTFPSGVPSGFFFGRVAFVDVDADGLLDFFYAGSVSEYSSLGISNLYVQSNGSSFEKEQHRFFHDDLPSVAAAF